MAKVSRHGLLQACVLGFCALFVAGNANADCTVQGDKNADPASLVNKQRVICNAVDPNPYVGSIEASATDTFGNVVTLRAEARLLGDVSLFDQSLVQLIDQSSIANLGGFGISVDSDKAGISNIFLSGSSSIDATNGIVLRAREGSAGSGITLTRNSKIQATQTGIKVIGTGNFVKIEDQASLTAATGVFISEVDSTNNSVTMSGQTLIKASGDSASGVYVEGSGNKVGLSGTAKITTDGGSAANPSRGVVLTGNKNSLTMQDNAAITGSGLGTVGVRVDGSQNSVILNGNSAIAQNGGVSGSIGVVLGGNANTLTLNNTSSIKSEGIGVAVTGTGNTINVAANAQIETDFHSGSAVQFFGAGNTLINAGSIIDTNNFNSTTVLGSAGADTVINRGFIFANGAFNKAVSLGDGDDTLTLDTGSDIVSPAGIDGGSGANTLLLNGTGTDNNQFLNWTLLTVDGVDWTLGGNSNFFNINVFEGNLSINGKVTANEVNVNVGGSLGGNGTLTVKGTVINKGTLDPGNSVGDLQIVGSLVQEGGDYEVQFDSNGIDRQDVSGTAELLADPDLPEIKVVALGGSTGASGVILKADGGITGSFGAVSYEGNGAASVTQTATTVSIVTFDGTNTAANSFAGTQTGLDFLDGLAGEQRAGLSGCHGACLFDQGPADHHLWVQGFGRFYQEDTANGNQSYAYRVAGTTMGGDMGIAPGLRLGGSLGYGNTAISLSDDGADSSINNVLGAIYANYQQGRFFVTGALSGGWQGYDLSRTVTVDNVQQTAQANPDGALMGISLQTGMCICGHDGWSFVPSLGFDYQHQWMDGFTEQGGGAAGVSMDSQSSDAIRLRAQAWVGKDFVTKDVVITPHASFGVTEQFNMGGTATGSFGNGDGFGIAQIDGQRTMGDLGAGVDVTLRNGVTLYANYDGQVWGDGYANAVIGGVRISW